MMMYVKVFLVGGALCALGEVLLLRTKLTSSRILVLYVVSGVLLTALGLYEPLVRFAGCGATTPLTGFGYLLATGVKEAVQQKGLLGVFTGGLTAASGGLSAAIALGACAGIFFRAKTKS